MGETTEIKRGKHPGCPFLPTFNLLPELPVTSTVERWRQGNLGIVVPCDTERSRGRDKVD